MGYRQALGLVSSFVLVLSMAACTGPILPAVSLPSAAPTRAATLTPEPSLTPSPTLLPTIIPLNLPTESEMEAAFSRDWASLVARLESAPQGNPGIPAESEVVLVPRTARLAYVQSHLWPEIPVGEGGSGAVYVLYDYSRGSELGYLRDMSYSFSTETLEIISVLELFVEQDGQLQRAAALETTGGEGDTSLTGVVRSAVPAQDWIPGGAADLESRLEAAIGYACGIAMLPDLAYENQVNLLTFALDGPDWAGRRAAAETLGNMQPLPIASASFLVKALGDSEYKVAQAAEGALKGMIADPRVYALAVAGLGDPAAGVRKSSMRLLAALPERPAELLDQVMVLFNDEDIYVRQEARFWLAGCELREIIGLMVAELAGSDDERRSEAAQVLKSCGESAYSAAPALTAMLLDDNPDLREVAASGLANIADNSQTVVNGLTQAVHVETDSQALEAEIYAIKTLEGEAAAFALLKEALQSPLPDIRHSSCDSLISYTRTPGALELLVTALDDPDSGVRIAAAVALIYFGDDALPVVPKLIAMLADPEPSVSYQVSFALETITNQTFGEDAGLWNAWWEQNHP